MEQLINPPAPASTPPGVASADEELEDEQPAPHAPRPDVDRPKVGRRPLGAEQPLEEAAREAPADGLGGGGDAHEVGRGEGRGRRELGGSELGRVARMREHVRELVGRRLAAKGRDGAGRYGTSSRGVDPPPKSPRRTPACGARVGPNARS